MHCMLCSLHRGCTDLLCCESLYILYPHTALNVYTILTFMYPHSIQCTAFYVHCIEIIYVATHCTFYTCPILSSLYIVHCNTLSTAHPFPPWLSSMFFVLFSAKHHYIKSINHWIPMAGKSQFGNTQISWVDSE